MTAIVSNIQTDEQWDFDTVEQAVEWIGKQERVDYHVVFAGDYQIDDMGDPDAEPATCWDCDQRIGEECGLDGHEVYPDSEPCDQFSN